MDCSDILQNGQEGEGGVTRSQLTWISGFDGYQHDMYELVRTQDPMCTNMDWMIANRLSLGMVDLA